MAQTRSYWVETLGCPKNQVDSDKLVGTLEADGLTAAPGPDEADVVVVNTCAFIEAARQESIDTILAVSDIRRPGSKLVVTGCMAERYGEELADALPEVDRVSGFGVPVALGRKNVPSLDLLNLPRPRSARPWAYVKIAEGCDRSCGFCAIPSFRGKQRSRSTDEILREVDELGAGDGAVKEIVLVAQDLASYGKDVEGMGAGSIVPLVEAVSGRVPRTRLLYLYPSDLSDELIEVIGGPSGVAYYDLSLQHVSKPLLRRMRRWGDGDRFLRRIADIRRRFPEAAFRSNFIVGYPGETEHDHDLLLRFVEEADLDWVGFFAYSREEGTFAAGLDGAVDEGLVKERLVELTELQEGITSARRRALVGRRIDVLVDAPGTARSHRETPEIDGIVEVPESLAVGEFHEVEVRGGVRPRPRGRLSVRSRSMSTTSFGPSALLTPANAITIGRLVLTPVWLVVVVAQGPSWTSFGLGFVLASTDGLDGYVARRQGTTRSGAYLDPLADKFLVVGGLVALVVAGAFWWLPVALITVREVGISLYRSWVAKRGISVPASYWAKVKTVVQEIAIGLALLPVTAEVPYVAKAVLWAGVVLALSTGAHYLIEGRKAARTAAADPDPR